jgi:hypothetical protein
MFCGDTAHCTCLSKHEKSGVTYKAWCKSSSACESARSKTLHGSITPNYIDGDLCSIVNKSMI